MKKVFSWAFGISLACFLGITQTLLGQSCGTDHYHQRLHQQNPQAHAADEARAMAFYERIHQQLTKASVGIAYKTSNRSSTKSEYFVPVVVHVVHTGGRDSLSIETVRSQFDLLFDHYRTRPGSRGASSGTDTRIEFCLATKDPQGRPHPGVTHTRNDELSVFDMGRDDGALKNLVRWDNSRYCNVWLVNDLKNNNAAGQTLGFAQFPWVTGPAAEQQDGIVILASEWGFNARDRKPSATASHEFGHWLGLLHPFQNGCGNADCRRSGDNLCDTPASEANRDNQNKDHRSRWYICESTNLPPIFNKPQNPRIVMDYPTDFSIPNLITREQGAVMRATLVNPDYPRRINLTTDQNLRATGTGKYGRIRANFAASKTVGCSGSTITFYDYSSGDAQTYFWQFPGGQPATSNDPEPTVTYNRPGRYTVKLLVGNANPDGIEDSITKVGYIHILNDTTYKLPFEERFVTPRDARPLNWFVENPDSAIVTDVFTWEKNRLAGFQNDGAMIIRNYQYSDYGQRDGLVTPSIDVSQADSLTFEFKYAYSPLLHRSRNSKPYIYTDTLEVYVTTDCGETWERIWRKGGLQLNTVPGRQWLTTTTTGEGGELERPVQANWQTERLGLNAYKRKGQLRFKFVSICGFGNNLYIDDVKLEERNANTQVVSRPSLTPAEETDVLLFPNPVNEAAALHYTTPTPTRLTVMVFDLSGKVVRNPQDFPLNAGIGVIPYNLSELTRGLYIIRTQTQHGFIKSQKVFVP